MTKIPAEFADFVQKKQKELLFNILTSSAAGIALANTAALVAGDASLAVLVQTIQSQLPLFLLTAVVSFLARR